MVVTRRSKSKTPLTSEKSTGAGEEKAKPTKTPLPKGPASQPEPSTTLKSSETKTQSDPQPGQKRKVKELTNDFLRAQAKKPRVAKPSVAENNLKDSVREGLILISVGLNPGIMTGKTGHAYAHPSNRYWPTLHQSGITPILHHPSETHSLQDTYGLGHTNIIPDLATQGGADLTKDDYAAGAQVLDEKIRALRPQAVMLVGKGIWEEWFRYKRGRKMNKSDGPFKYGWQNEALWVGRKNGVWEGARTFVATTTSGLSSAHTVEERVAIWKPMGDWFRPKREQWVKEREREQEQGQEKGKTAVKGKKIETKKEKEEATEAEKEEEKENKVLDVVGEEG